MSDLYPVSPNNPANAADVNQLVAVLNGQNDAPFHSYQPLAAPSAPTAAIGGTGVLNGAYAYCAVFRTGYVDGVGVIHYSGHQTAAGTASTTVNPSDNAVDLSAIPLGPTGVVARDLYRTQAGGSTFYYLATLADNVTTDYTDNTPDSSLGTTTAPTVNTTGSPPELPVYAAVPGFAAPEGALAFVNNGTDLLLYQSTGSAWAVSAPPIPLASPTAAGIVDVAQSPPSGDPVTPSIIARPAETALTTTAATTIFTVTPADTGMFVLYLYARVVTAATTVTATLTYTSNSGAQTYPIWNAQDLPVEDSAAVPYTFQNVGGDAITLQVTAGTADQVYINTRVVAI